jgi:predicted permease
MAAATFMNSNSLPVALLQSLAATVPGLKWGKDDTKDAIIGRALTYLLLCSTIGQFVRPSPSLSYDSTEDGHRFAGATAFTFSPRLIHWRR